MINETIRHRRETALISVKLKNKWIAGAHGENRVRVP